MDGKFLDDPALEPFWAEATRRFVFVHPALKLNYSQQFDGYDTARSVGREFSLVMATIRLINSGVLDRHPNLTVHMSHLGGGIARPAVAEFVGALKKLGKPGHQIYRTMSNCCSRKSRRASSADLAVPPAGPILLRISLHGEPGTFPAFPNRQAPAHASGKRLRGFN